MHMSRCNGRRIMLLKLKRAKKKAKKKKAKKKKAKTQKQWAGSDFRFNHQQYSCLNYEMKMLA